jgi:hypothetical protein
MRSTQICPCGQAPSHSGASEDPHCAWQLTAVQDTPSPWYIPPSSQAICPVSAQLRVLTQSFNRMKKSLVQAMKMLEG